MEKSYFEKERRRRCSGVFIVNIDFKHSPHVLKFTSSCTWIYLNLDKWMTSELSLVDQCTIWIGNNYGWNNLLICHFSHHSFSLISTFRKDPITKICKVRQMIEEPARLMAADKKILRVSTVTLKYWSIRL